MKTGLFKDKRDTTNRRTRHRDGRLLCGGIGLTTGLGWSDRYVNTLCDLLSSYPQLHAYSEDGDSLSPLTRRLSPMALSRTSSFASLRSQYATGTSHPRMQITTPADGTLQSQSPLRSSAFSTTSPASTRLPSTRADDANQADPNSNFQGSIISTPPTPSKPRNQRFLPSPLVSSSK